jgi:arylsulfatase A-like enzyme
MLSRRHFVATGAAAALPAVAPPPNLLFLLADDQRWDTLGCMGNRIIRTPHVDRLAAAGVTFTNHFVTTSICMTSRASIFTGQYARTHTINDFSQPFSTEQYARIYPVLLRQAGYRTGFIGKWGVGNQMPRERFDFFAGFPGQGKYFQERDGRTVHLTGIMRDQGLEFLSGCSREQPFCLSISFKAPHVQDEDPRQFLYEPEYEQLYQDTRIPAPETADPRYFEALPEAVRKSEGRRRWDIRFSNPELYQRSVKGYYRLITGIDAVVGRLVAELKSRGLDRNTVIVYTGDNGFYLGEHGLAGKWLMHEESLRVPLVVYDPRLPAAARGKRRSEMTLNIDLAPTLLRLAGVPVPPVMQGRDLLPLVRGERTSWRGEWFYEHMFTARGRIPPSEGIRTSRWKYGRYLDIEPRFEELYDLERDPRETRNLAREESSRPRLEKMRARREAWLRHFEALGPKDAWREPAGA